MLKYRQRVAISVNKLGEIVAIETHVSTAARLVRSTTLRKQQELSLWKGCRGRACTRTIASQGLSLADAADTNCGCQMLAQMVGKGF